MVKTIRASPSLSPHALTKPQYRFVHARAVGERALQRPRPVRATLPRVQVVFLGFIPTFQKVCRCIVRTAHPFPFCFCRSSGVRGRRGERRNLPRKSPRVTRQGVLLIRVLPSSPTPAVVGVFRVSVLAMPARPTPSGEVGEGHEVDVRASSLATRTRSGLLSAGNRVR
ncbi:unnamed protein product [Chondrus crispus]|uniref:Uncharacterized protein n=1 Tax=Chondrus crispus TaxID=2769 RepID=R7QMV8_CHOCR|nr:unnamed protein product [Chondrus crispus]CDF39424.1 unnamed protein product [Chondrus crispus]|eukprot:XP_005719335.1 unnamed protein product [Chondrus crispus]